MIGYYDVFLLLIFLLVGLALRRRAAAPVAELGVIEQLERKLSSLENQKRKLKRQISEVRARACRSESRLLDDAATTRGVLAQVSRDLEAERDRSGALQEALRLRSAEATALAADKRRLETAVASLQKSVESLEDPALHAHNREETFKLVHLCRCALSDILEGAVQLADRRNSAVSKLYFELFGETNTDVRPLGELIDPWRRWAELVAAHRDQMDRMFARCLDRASRNKPISLDELPESVGLQEPEHGFEQVLDLVRSRLAPAASRSESPTDLEYAPSTDSSPTGNARDGGADDSPKNTRRTGYLKLARTLQQRMPEVPEERLVVCLETLRTRNGGLTGLRISKIKEEVARLVRDSPPSGRRPGSPSPSSDSSH